MYTIKLESKTDILLFFLRNSKDTKRLSVQRACGLDTILKYLVEFKKNKISLDFCLAHAFIFIEARESPKVDFFSAMEKKNEQHF